MDHKFYNLRISCFFNWLLSLRKIIKKNKKNKVIHRNLNAPLSFHWNPLTKCSPQGAISCHLTMKQWSGFWICSGFISALSVIFKQQRAKQITLALHRWHCWLIWLTDEYKIICNSFSVSKQMKHRPALVWMEGVGSSTALLFTSVCRTWRSRRMRLDVGQLSAGWRGWAPSPGGQQSATVKGSVYPRCHRERSSGRGQPLSSHGCVSVCASMQREQSGVCWRL